MQINKKYVYILLLNIMTLPLLPSSQRTAKTGSIVDHFRSQPSMSATWHPRTIFDTSAHQQFAQNLQHTMQEHQQRKVDHKKRFGENARQQQRELLHVGEHHHQRQVAYDATPHSTLYHATANGDLATAEQAIRDGAHPNHLNPAVSETPLHRAVKQGRTNHIKLLLKHGANPLEYDGPRWTKPIAYDGGHQVGPYPVRPKLFINQTPFDIAMKQARQSNDDTFNIMLSHLIDQVQAGNDKALNKLISKVILESRNGNDTNLRTLIAKALNQSHHGEHTVSMALIQHLEKLVSYDIEHPSMLDQIKNPKWRTELTRLQRMVPSSTRTQHDETIRPPTARVHSSADSAPESEFQNQIEPGEEEA